MYRFLRRGDSGSQGEEIEEVVTANAPGGILTAVRTGSGRLRLIRWTVNSDGTISHAVDSANLAGNASHISMVVRSDRAVVACRTVAGNLRLIEWHVPADGPITRLGDSRDPSGKDQAGEATLIKIAVLPDANEYITGARTSAGDLQIIRWRVNPDHTFDRLDTSREEDAERNIRELDLAQLFFSGGMFATAVRDSDGDLKVILWTHLSTSTGGIGRLKDTGNLAGEATLIRLVSGGGGRVFTSSRTADGRLRVIAWDMSMSGAEMRRGDSANQAGRILKNVLFRLDENSLVSAVKTSEEKLRLILWDVRDGAVVRAGDSSEQAGEVGEISLNSDSPPLVSAVQTAAGRLKLISWFVCGRSNTAPDPGPIEPT
jgi:hypothetical protein